MDGRGGIEESMSITVVGSVGLDTVETPFGNVRQALGGAAVYFSVAAGMYCPVKLVGVVGDDFPDEHYDFLRDQGIDVEGLVRKPGSTFAWSGRYEYDLNVRHTLDTQLNVFADFRPQLPEAYCDSPYLFLANIDPELQLDVLRQARPKLTMMDSMNYWIEGKREALDEVIRSVDIVLLNDSEMREYSGHYSLVECARKVLSMGPKAVIVKKGEHGAVLVTEDEVFVAPAYPLAEVRDPTGAGDSFAGGFLGYLAHAGEASEGAIRRAIIHGSVVASFVVEDFSLDRFRGVTLEQIAGRYREFQGLVRFEEPCISSHSCPLRTEADVHLEALVSEASGEHTRP